MFSYCKVVKTYRFYKFLWSNVSSRVQHYYITIIKLNPYFRPAVITLWLLPDIAVLATSIAVFLVVRTAVRTKPENVEQGEAAQQTVGNSSEVGSARKSNYLLIPNFDRLINICKYIWRFITYVDVHYVTYSIRSL